ncbi:MAG: mannose-1-phosphate guanylyltransferase/mannose-6-phosphate isomerase [Pseudomonadota bacterium]
MTVAPVILAGGVGSRLWPMSRPERPKQFLPLTSERSLLQETLARLDPADLFSAPTVICHQRYQSAVEEQVRGMGAGARLDALILEPEARNSAPAVAVAACYHAARDPETLVLIKPADHLISEPTAFHAAVRRAAEAAREGYLTTFGITPDRPETGFGYIRAGEPLAAEGAFKVSAFVEKPDRETAERYVAEGSYSWNSGMFLFRARDMIAELETHAPDMLAAAQASVDTAPRDGHALPLPLETFRAAPEDSIDYAVMEKTARAAVVPASFGWSDIGAWDALASKIEGDGDGNSVIGDASLIGTRNTYCRSDGPFVAAIGVEDLIIVATDDAVLVTTKAECQQVKKAVAAFKARRAGDNG